MKKLIIYETGFGIHDSKTGVTNSITTKLDDTIVQEQQITEEEYESIVGGEKSPHDILRIYENNSGIRTDSKNATREQHEGVEDNESVSAGQGGLSVSITSKAGQDRIRRP